MGEDLLLDVDYTTVDEAAEIRLFVRDRVLHARSFAPYFYVMPENNSSPKDLEIFGRVEEVEKLLFGENKKLLRLEVKHPSEVPKIREEVRNLDWVKDIFEHDIFFARRYLIDKRLAPLITVEYDEKEGVVSEVKSTGRAPDNLNVMSFDIEVYNPKGAPRPNRDPIIMISLASNTGVRKLLTYKKIEGPDYLEVYQDEAAILKRFVEIVKVENIDFLVGYNSDQFDLPYIMDRVKALGIELPLGRDNKGAHIRKGRGLTESVVRGRPHVDLYPIVRRNVKLSSYVLENVVKDVLGIEKEKIPSDLMWQYWDRGGKELLGFMQYSMEDADVTLELAEKFLPQYIELTRIVGLPIQDVSRMTAGQLVEWLLIRDAFVRGELVPNKGGGREFLERRDATYEGGYVMEPEKGLIENIVVFDFRSLYPSIIVTHNIDPTTLKPGRGENSPPEIDYHFTTDKEGFLPSVLNKILERRVEAKRKMKEETDPLKKRMFDVSQNALKIIANSFYGYMGYPRARWYKKECAESVTSFARMYTKKVMAIAESEFGFKVVYGDTDSLFIVVPAEKKEQAMNFMTEANKLLPGTIELEYDGFYPRGIFVTKKRYALIDENQHITVKGLETVRRDWAMLSRRTQQNVLEALLKDGDPKKAVQIVKDVITLVKERQIDLKDIAISTQLTRKIDKYKNKGPHVIAAEKSIERGREINPGTPITYVINTGKGLISQRSEPIEDATIEDYDIDYYVENQILPPVARIMEALGYSEEHLKEELTQGSLAK